MRDASKMKELSGFGCGTNIQGTSSALQTLSITELSTDGNSLSSMEFVDFDVFLHKFWPHFPQYLKKGLGMYDGQPLTVR
jgi:hypothetical protein